jgi:hypothetical protein
MLLVCTEIITKFHGLKPKVQSLKSQNGKVGDKRQGTDFELLKKVYEWMFVPMSIWPVDVRGGGAGETALARDNESGVEGRRAEGVGDGTVRLGCENG